MKGEMVARVKLPSTPNVMWRFAVPRNSGLAYKLVIASIFSSDHHFVMYAQIRLLMIIICKRTYMLKSFFFLFVIYLFIDRPCDPLKARATHFQEIE